MDDLEGIPLVFAGWLRYLMGVDDRGNPFTPSPDPLLDTLTPLLADVKPGGDCDVRAVLTPILQRSDIFGVDVSASVLGDKVIALFAEMIQGPGAVAALLEKRYGTKA